MKAIATISTLTAGIAVAVCTMPGQAAQSPAQDLPRKPAVASPRTGSVRIAVKDQDGASLSGARLVLSGTGTGEFVTSGAGTVVVPDLKDGVYKVRCEREGFIAREREFTIRAGAYSQIEVVLSAAPPAPPKPAPEPAPAPVPRGGSPLTMSIVDFLDKNLIGREPLKESILACNPLETVRLLQMREGIAQHAHERLDEILYVVAGEGTVRIGEQASPVRAGSLLVVTSGTGHVSTLVGAPCEHTDTAR
jgi:hypothetical protein